MIEGRGTSRRERDRDRGNSTGAVGEGLREEQGGKVVQMAITIKGRCGGPAWGQPVDRLMDSTSGPKH